MKRRHTDLFRMLGSIMTAIASLPLQRSAASGGRRRSNHSLTIAPHTPARPASEAAAAEGGGGGRGRGGEGTVVTQPHTQTLYGMKWCMRLIES